MPNKRSEKNRKIKNENTEPMPSLIFNSIKLQGVNDEEQKNDTRTIFPGNHGAKHFMLGGVMVLSAIIFFLWGWAMIARISHVNISKTPEGQLAASAKKDWGQVFEETKMAEAKKQTMTQIKNIISQLITSSTPPSTSSSTVILNNSSTTPGVINTTTTISSTTVSTTTKQKK